MGGLDEVLPGELFYFEEVHFEASEDLLLEDVSHLVVADELVAVLVDVGLGARGSTAMRCNLSKMVPSSMEGPQLLPSRMESSRSWQ